MWELGTISRPCLGPRRRRRWAKEAFFSGYIRTKHTVDIHAQPVTRLVFANAASLAQRALGYQQTPAATFHLTDAGASVSEPTISLPSPPSHGLELLGGETDILPPRVHLVALVFVHGFMHGWEPAVRFNRSGAQRQARGQRRTKPVELAQKQWIRNCLTLSCRHNLTFCFVRDNYWGNFVRQHRVLAFY